jgi:maleylpyruvate isomerase
MVIGGTDRTPFPQAVFPSAQGVPAKPPASSQTVTALREDGPERPQRHGGITVDDDVSLWLASVGAATDRLLAASGALTDGQVREPSLLPGWTRGHVLSHIARNADGLGNLLRWARTGTQMPMYASQQAREADIEAGAGRDAAELAADVRNSAAEFAERAASLPAAAWTLPVKALRGGMFPASGILERRLSEVEIHHVDLGTGYQPADWPAEFVADALPRVAGSFCGRQDAPSCRILPDGRGEGFWIGPADGGAEPLVVVGTACDLLAWLLGRAPGTGLRVVSGSDLPTLPAWR